jgi:hypothetical protein
MAQDELLRGSALLGVADTIVKLADEREKPDAERKLGFQERDAKDLEQSAAGDAERVRPRERPRVAQAVPAARGEAAGGRAPGAAGRDRRQGPGDGDIDRALDGLYKATKLGDKDARVALLRTTRAKLARARTRSSSWR